MENWKSINKTPEVAVIYCDTYFSNIQGNKIIDKLTKKGTKFFTETALVSGPFCHEYKPETRQPIWNYVKSNLQESNTTH